MITKTSDLELFALKVIEILTANDGLDDFEDVGDKIEKAAIDYGFCEIDEDGIYSKKCPD